jgi:ferredoxin/flavodoxin---NADP+ reductase
MSKWVQGSLVAKKRWTDRLVSIEIAAPEVTFVAGQFGRLGLPAPPGAKEEMVGRPYSFVNPPGTPHHEFFFNVVPEGPLSPRLAVLECGNPVWLMPNANGFFTMAEVPAAETLWCISTGTGIGPFLSILRTDEPWQKFGRVVLVHAVRIGADLAYRDVIDGVLRKHSGAFTFVPVVSREPHPAALPGRIPALITDGRLETRAGEALTAENAHAMLCGNPAMVDDVQAVLATRGMKRHRRREPGQITLETYW